MSLLDMIESSAGPGALQMIGSRVGLSPDQLRSVITSVAPNLAPKLAKHADNGGLDNDPEASAPPTPGTDEASAHGNGILGAILGSKDASRSVASDASAQTGVSAQQIEAALPNVVKTSGSKKGFGLLLALALALFGARSAAGSVITALNIAYEEKERRSFVVVNLLALAITAVSACVAALAVVATAALGHLAALLQFAPGVVLVLGKLVSYIVFALGAAAAAATLYRYGPSRADPRWVWLTPGSLFAAVVWVALTLGFGIYVAQFGNYNATYGSLGAVVVLLTWMYLSSYVLLFGAEINSAVEDESQGEAKSEATAAPDHQSEKHATGEDSTKADAAHSLTATRKLPSEAATAQSSVTQSWAANLAIACGGLRMARDARLKDVGEVSSECARLVCC